MQFYASLFSFKRFTGFMKFAITKEHRDFFQKQGWIEFEELLSSDQVVFSNQTIDKILVDRLHKPLEKLGQLSSEQLFQQGRDLWRSNPSLVQLTKQTRFAEIASELIEKKPLRLGYDQFFPSPAQAQPTKGTPHVYAQFIANTTSLEAVSCLQGIVCALMLALGPESNPLSDETIPAEGINVFSATPGNAIFFLPHFPVNWSYLQAFPSQRFYLIVYTQAMAYYLLQPKDPHAHALKHLGYIFNDQLNDKLNPIVYR